MIKYKVALTIEVEDHLTIDDILEMLDEAIFFDYKDLELEEVVDD